MTKRYVKKAAEAIYKDLVRKKIAVEKRRPDGRSETADPRRSCEVRVSPRTHGSGLFTRGQTQIMSLLTLGTAKEGQRIDDLSLEKDRRYMHHYNFPPFSVGETGRMTRPAPPRHRPRRARSAGARGRAFRRPTDFPYTIRVVSETLESNGSSSMGSVCGSTLALMDAGVPIKAPVSGIAMGLVKEGDDYVILTDIQGAEDHLGDMDFKVAGTRDGHHRAPDGHQDHGRLREIMEQALAQAKRGARGDPRPDAPGDLGAAHASSPGTRRGSRPSRSTPSTSAWSSARAARRSARSRPTTRCRSTSRRTARSSSTPPRATKGDAAISAITALTKEPEVGDEFTGKVVKTTDFGAFVELKKGTDGLLHVSNVGPGRVEPHRGRHPSRRCRSTCVVQEVDKARGRIGLKLVQKHENGSSSRRRSSSSGRRTPRRARRARSGRAATAAAVAVEQRGSGGGRGPRSENGPHGIASRLGVRGGAGRSAHPSRACRRAGSARARPGWLEASVTGPRSGRGARPTAGCTGSCRPGARRSRVARRFATATHGAWSTTSRSILLQSCDAACGSLVWSERARAISASMRRSQNSARFGLSAESRDGRRRR